MIGVVGGSVAWGDYDGDGDLDVAISGTDQVSAFTYVSRIYRNDAGTFTDIGAGLLDLAESSVAWGDYDGDGDLDLALAGSRSEGFFTVLYRNDGGTFTDVGAGMLGLADGDVEWGDFDNDGDLDLVVAGYRETFPAQVATKIYRNDGGDSFTDAGASLTGVSSSSVAWGDYDGDGDLDLLLAGSDPVGDRATKLYRNDGGTFTDIGAGLPNTSSGTVAWGDYDADGDLDILLTGFTGNGRITRIYRNDAGSFLDIDAGLPGISGSAAWGNYDSDGDLDVVIAGWTGSGYVARVYRQGNDHSFVDWGEALSGVNGDVVAWGDYDNDRLLDILVAGRDAATNTPTTRIYENTRLTPNGRPNTPENLSASFSNGIATFSWDATTDANQPSAGLTYNLRVGLTQGGDEIFASMADPSTGVRYVASMGNVQHRLSWSLDLSGIPQPYDSVHWSVQAIDTDFLASNWAWPQFLILEESVSAPSPSGRFELHPNIPNPFNPSTSIRFDLPRTANVELAIYDLAGRRVRTLVEESRAAGRHEVMWHGEDDSGRPLASGTYLYRLTTGQLEETRRMVLLK